MKHLVGFLLITAMVIIFPPIILVFLLEGDFQKKRDQRKDIRDYKEAQFYAKLNKRY